MMKSRPKAQQPDHFRLGQKKRGFGPSFSTRTFFVFILPVVSITFLVYNLSVGSQQLLPVQVLDSPQQEAPVSVSTPEDAKGETDKKDETLIRGSLPSARLLLTKPPPFKDSDAIKLSNNLITSPNTVVTAYFVVPSKFKKDNYDKWMTNMLSIQDAMVVFTHAELVPQIEKLRNHALNRTVIVPIELDDLPIGTLYSKEFWKNQLDIDPEKKIHRSYQLLWIWLSKTWCVTQAIRMNFFQSDLFVWSDIGCFRDKRMNDKTMIRYRENVPPHEMLQMAHHPPNPPEEVLWADKYNHKEHYYHSGSQFVAYKNTFIQFHDYFLETIDKFLERNMFIGEDQHVLQSVCLQHPELCAYAPFNLVKDNHYFGLRSVLHKPDKIEYWRHIKQ